MATMVSFDIGIRNMSYCFLKCDDKKVLSYGILDIFADSKSSADFGVITEHLLKCLEDFY